MTVNGLKSLQRSLEDLQDNLEEETHQVAEEALDSTERYAKRRVVEQDAVASTDLYRGFKQTSHPIHHVQGAGKRFRLTNTAPHAKFVEWGTGDYFGTSTRWGFTPPREKYDAPSMSTRLVLSIVQWITVKPGFRRSGPPVSMAYPIARSIATRTEDSPRVGTGPQPFMRPAWFVQSSGIKQRFENAVARAIRRA